MFWLLAQVALLVAWYVVPAMSAVPWWVIFLPLIMWPLLMLTLMVIAAIAEATKS